MTIPETKRKKSAPYAPQGLSRLMRELRKSGRQTKVPCALWMIGHPRHIHNLAQGKFFKKCSETTFNLRIEKHLLFVLPTPEHLS